jgi:hypothetical protein
MEVLYERGKKSALLDRVSESLMAFAERIGQ